MKEYKDRKLLYVHDGRVYVDREGRIYGSLEMIKPLLERYKYLAPTVIFAHRAALLDEIKRNNFVEYKEHGIQVIPLPDVTSLKGMLKNTSKAKQILSKAIESCDMLILRNSKNASLAQPIAERLRKPFIFEVVSCNWDALWNYSLKGKLYAPYAYLRMKFNVAKSKYAIYVTQEFLQKRYPNKHTNAGISDVIITPVDKSLLENKLKLYQVLANPIILTTCAAVDVKYKGQEFIIRAISKLKDKYNIVYHVAGGGNNSYLKKIAQKCGVEEQVVFDGLLTKSQVDNLLDQTIIYCQPSKQEGLPRAVVEAMSRGCVAIVSRTGGMPELIDDEFISKPGDVEALVRTIDKLLSNQALLISQSKKNFNKALEFAPCVLDKARNTFYDNFIKEN